MDSEFRFIQKSLVIPSSLVILILRVFYPELFPGLGNRLRFKIIQRGTFADLGRPISPAAPDGALFVGMFRKLSPARPNPYICRTIEADRAVPCRTDLKKDNSTGRVIKNMGFKADIWLQADTQPEEEILTAFSFHGIRVKVGTDYVMGGIGNAKNEIPSTLSGEAGAIGKCGKIFPNYLGFMPIFLEFKPFSLIRFPTQTINQGYQL